MQPVVIMWPGGEHAFRLGLAELETIQQKTDCGPEWMLHRLNSGQWTAAELFEILRCGLIGGGMDHVTALQAVRANFGRHPLIAFKVPAQEVLSACLFGPPDDPVGEVQPASPTPATESAGDGSSASSTALEP